MANIAFDIGPRFLGDGGRRGSYLEFANQTRFCDVVYGWNEDGGCMAASANVVVPFNIRIRVRAGFPGLFDFARGGCLLFVYIYRVFACCF